MKTAITALIIAFTVWMPWTAVAQNVTPPAVPENLEVPDGSTAYLIGRAYGTQNYICLLAGGGFAWTFLGPQATVFDDTMQQITTHYLGANPSEGGTLRATWQHSADTSAVWAVAIGSSLDPGFVAPDSIPWLLLRSVGAKAGPLGGDVLAVTTFIQRVNTSGGLAPAAGCKRAGDIGKKAFVPYTADYVFYRQ